MFSQHQGRESRIKQTKHFIQENTSASLLNNKKWHSILEKIQEEGQSIKIKTLLSDFSFSCDFIREIELSSALFDDTGNFIEYFEIEYITLKRTDEMLRFLNKLNVNYSDNLDQITIIGYLKKTGYNHT